MIWEIVKAGVYAWKEHKIIGLPFFIYGLTNTALTLSVLLYVFYAISPEIPTMVFSGKIISKDAEYFVQLLKKYLENLNFLFYAFDVWLIFHIAIDAFFKPLCIRLCSDALEGNVSIFEALMHAKTRYISYMGYMLIICSVIFFSQYPLYLAVTHELNLFQSAFTLFIWIIAIGSVVMILMALFIFVPYAIVVDAERLILSFKKGLRILRISIAETVILFLLFLLVSTAIAIPFQLFQIFGIKGVILGYALSALVNWLIIAPVTTAWWVELYKRKSKVL